MLWFKVSLIVVFLKFVIYVNEIRGGIMSIFMINFLIVCFWDIFVIKFLIKGD